WTDQNGNITVVNGKAATGTAAGSNLSTVNGINQGDVSVMATVNLTAGQSVGLVTRYGGTLESNLYLGQFFGAASGKFQATIWKNIGGNYTLLTTGLTVTSGTGTLEFEAVGPSLKMIFTPDGGTGMLVAFADDLSLTSGSVGMRLSQNASVSLFQANAVMQK